MRHRLTGLAVVAVVLACAIAMAMAALVPAGEGRAVRLDAIAAALRGTGDATLARTTAAVPPAERSDRWATAAGGQRRLAAILRVDPRDVRLSIAVPMRMRPERQAAAGQATIRAGFLLIDQEQPVPPVIAVPAPAAPPPRVMATPAPTAGPRPDPAARSVPPKRPARRVRPARAAAPVIPAPAVVAVPTTVPDVAAAPVPVAAPAMPTPAVAMPAPSSGPMPELRGAFRAALRLPSGGWAIVEPRPEVFPTTAQQAVLLWFLVALAVTVPLTWVAALWLVRPLRAFGAAAERAGRDPADGVATRAMPPELMPAVVALARLQGRVQALIADRSAFAGTLRTELQAPLKRLRAGLDDAPRQIREAFHDDVTDIEEAVAALALFLADATAPVALVRHDLSALVRAAATTAAARGEPVVAEADEPLWVEVDGDAITRLLDVLIGYARRQDGMVSMRTGVEDGMAVVAIGDTPRPVSGGFAPGLRARADRAGGTKPKGPGLALARSIARTHGGEMRLVRSAGGVTTELRLPTMQR